MRRRWPILLAVVALGLPSVELTAASFSSASANPTNAFSARSDWSPPTANAAVIAKSAGGTAGYIREAGTYHVYASVTDAGNPASGIATVTADVGSITSGRTAAALTAGSYSIDGRTYNYRSTALTANTTLPAGNYSYTLSLTDTAGNGAAQSGFNVVVDNTAPSAADVQTTNVTGGTAGKAELGDGLVLTYSETIDPNSIIANWNGTTANIVIRITDGGLLGNDVLTIRNANNSTQLPLGSIDLGRIDYVLASRDFGATETPSDVTQSGSALTLKLGTPSGTTGTALGTASMIWTPSASATDPAGNSTSTTARTETGTADLGF